MIHIEYLLTNFLEINFDDFYPHSTLTILFIVLPGYYCENAGLTAPTAPCSAGYFCTLGANISSPTDGSTGDICPAGFYCEIGSPAPTPCGNGTFMNHTGADVCDICPEGYFCINGDRADVCTQGFYCPLGTGYDLQSCPIGTFGGSAGLKEQAECTDCSRKKMKHSFIL